MATLYEAVGGSSRVLMAAAEALRAEHTVLLRAPWPDAERRTALSLSALVLDTWRRKIAALPRLARLFFSELAFLASERPDIVYVHDEPSLYIFGLIARLCRVRVVWHVHMSEGQGLRRALRNALCDAKVFVSQSLVVARQNKPWTVVANPIVIGPVTRRTTNDAGRVVGMLGSISRLKNQGLGLGVLAELRRRGVPARLAIYGKVLDADYRDRLAVLAKEMGIDNAVEFRGFLKAELALSEIDVLLACSRYESFGLAVAEALAVGVPVVATDIAAHREFAPPSDTPALTICAADAGAMASAVMAAQPDENLAAQVRKTFSREKFADAISSFFRELSD